MPSHECMHAGRARRPISHAARLTFRAVASSVPRCISSRGRPMLPQLVQAAGGPGEMLRGRGRFRQRIDESIAVLMCLQVVDRVIFKGGGKEWWSTLTGRVRAQNILASYQDGKPVSSIPSAHFCTSFLIFVIDGHHSTPLFNSGGGPEGRLKLLALFIDKGLPWQARSWGSAIIIRVITSPLDIAGTRLFGPGPSWMETTLTEPCSRPLPARAFTASSSGALPSQGPKWGSTARCWRNVAGIAQCRSGRRWTSAAPPPRLRRSNTDSASTMWVWLALVQSLL